MRFVTLHKRQRNSFGNLFLVIIAFIFSACYKEREVKIGFMGPMTGDYSNYGQLQSKAVQLALDQFTEQGGVGNGIHVSLIIEDTEGKADKGTEIAEELIHTDHIIGLLGPVFSGVALTVAEDFNAARIPMIAGSATIAGLTGKGDYVFRTVPSDSLQADILGRYIGAILGYKTLAILYTNNDYSYALTESVTKVYAEHNGQVVMSLGTPEGTKDFRTQLSQIQAAAPDAIFLPNYVAECAEIIRQMNEIGFYIPIISADGFNNPEIFDLLGSLADGVIFSASPTNNSPQRDDFTRLYREAYNLVPDSFSENIYDATMIMLEAIKGSYDSTRQRINPTLMRNYIRNINAYPGVSGAIEFDDVGNVKKGIAINTVIKGSEFRTIGVFSLVEGSLSLVSN